MTELAERLASGPITLEVGVEDEGHDVEGALAGVAQVEGAERSDRDPRLWRIHLASDVRADVARRLVERGIQLRQLRSEADDLDEIYRRYFSEETADVAAG
ncbi:MAG TPA: hypothetical protein VM638_02765, partial [Actinomycetota bacterium]|nr:hypothetical protein [Actinomycetota bacterium]